MLFATDLGESVLFPPALPASPFLPFLTRSGVVSCSEAAVGTFVGPGAGASALPAGYVKLVAEGAR